MTLTSNADRSNPRERLIEAFNRRGGVLTRRDIFALGFGSNTLDQLLKAGTIIRASHGLYRLAETVPFGTAAFSQACLAIPSGVVALQSALSYYELTTQIISAVEIAIPRRYPKRRLEIPLVLIPMPLSRFQWQVDQVRSPAGDRFRIFSIERTVCDCFAYRDAVAESIAFEGLRTYLELPTADINKLMEQANFTKTAGTIGPVIKARIA